MPGYELFKPIYLTHGNGSYLYDVDGNEYLDFIGGLGAGILGYGNEEYLEALRKQMDKMIYLDAARRNPLEMSWLKK